MTDREKLVELINYVREHSPVADFIHPYGAEIIADHLIANGVMVQPSPQNNHRKICPTTGLECIECVPGSPCAKLEQELETAQWYEPMTRWISVEDRLPEVEQGCSGNPKAYEFSKPVLATVAGCVMIGRFTYWHGGVFEFDGVDAEFDRDQPVGVTHWMPLPKPPKEETHADAT